jgi:hypothetical protein
VLFGAVEVLSNMDRLEVIHVLVDKLGNRNFSQITVRLIADESHRENVAQRRCDQVGILADEQL